MGPKIVRDATLLGQRLRETRLSLYGESGLSTLAEQLDIPPRTWTNYESGVTAPATVILHFVKLTGANPDWLLTGDGPRFSPVRPTTTRQA